MAGLAQRRALSIAQVNALDKEGVHCVAPSLYLQVREQGTRSSLLRYIRCGTNQWMGLGSMQDKTLTEAPDEAAMLRVLVKRGVDPIAIKREIQAKRKSDMKPKVPTFAERAQ